MKVSGGVGPFTFSWSNSGNYTLSNSQLPVQSVRLVNPTGATTITVTVTDQGTNCIYTASLLIKWTDEFFCYKIGTETYIKTCQNGVTVCERLRDARQKIQSGNATLGACSNKFVAEITELMVDVFPNPTSGLFGLVVQNAGSTVHIEIFDMNGKRLSAEDLPANQGIATQEYDFSHMPAGMYYVQVNDGDTFVTKKLVVRN